MTPEAVRLVVWDLDETFWSGTLTEGGIREYIDHNQNIVVELTKRGILNSICSKNDLTSVRSILLEHGIWDYFIFPSISWESKGPRLAKLVEAVQLRAESVLFIDDNQMNLAEAAHFVPGIQTASEKSIPALLGDVRLKGKDDTALTRLAQYKLLEKKNSDELASSGDNRAFLRGSEIGVEIDYMIDQNIDRAIELINRTNQLNFTKTRLPEDSEHAKRELRALINRYDVNAGLVKVVDRYGDYGYVGFFVVVGTRAEARLVHFCFSCRTLNMGIETFIYRWLGRPSLQIVGDTLTNVVTDRSEIDWIALSSDSMMRNQGSLLVERIVMRGGCDLGAMSHYLGSITKCLDAEFNTVRDNRQFRIDHSSFLGLVFEELDEESRRALFDIGYIGDDWDSILKRNETNSIWLLSFWVDSFAVLYRHRRLGFTVPFCMPFNPKALVDVTSLPAAEIQALIKNDAQRRQYAALCSNFDYVGKIDEAAFRRNMRLLLKGAGTDTLIFIILGPEKWRRPDGEVRNRPNEKKINSWIRAEIGESPNVTLVDIDDFCEEDKARDEELHFDRLTYKRAADFVIQRLRDISDGKAEGGDIKSS